MPLRPVSEHETRKTLQEDIKRMTDHHKPFTGKTHMSVARVYMTNKNIIVIYMDINNTTELNK